MRSVVVVVALLAACGDPCRSITVKDVALQCSTASIFNGEIHFDDAATFQSFLETDCLPDPDGSADQRAALVQGVDFTKDVLFVSVGAREETQRCVSDRKDDGVSVCDDGLRVAFADRITDTTNCAGKWTVAFTLPRAEMRAALDTPVGQ